MKNLTWLGVGGYVKLFKAESIEELSAFVRKNDFFTIGAGSNIIAGENIQKIILRLGRNFNYIKLENNRILAGGAVLDVGLARFALENSIEGFEFFSVIPGTVGGAVAMNAGAYGHQTSDILEKVSIIDENGQILHINNDEIGFGYRKNNLPKNFVFFEATFTAKKGQSEQIKSKMYQMTKQKQESQPYINTCGSIFKNPFGKKAWELIDASGLRGFSIGGAEISKKHCNFLINNGCKTSTEIEELCMVVRDEVEKKTNIKMEFEVIFL